MYLQDLFDTLAEGEFIGLALAHSTTGSIKEENYPQVITAINRGLRELYKRFLLKKKKVYLVQQSDVTRYYLRTKYLGYSEVTGPTTYLLDHPDEPFLNDINKIISAVDQDDLDIAINPPQQYLDQTYFRTAGHDVLDLTTELTEQIYTIEYQASYPKITITEDFDPEELELNYPDFIEEALCSYVASLLTRGRTSKASESEGYATNTWRAKYEQECLMINLLGLAEKAQVADNRFMSRGFI